ncbi:MAG: hypothetical protein CTY20_05830 [Hyphomicrobium sp.]|nr:MAG: hypothetical protein CTY20_05830 [Hyphomicrobium sp.]
MGGAFRGLEISDMRSVVGFLSLMAIGLVLAVIIALAAAGISSNWSGLEARASGGFRLDYPSLLLGLVLGLVIATLARLSWAEMPRRLAMWLMVNERNFYRLGMSAVFLGVLLFY